MAERTPAAQADLWYTVLGAIQTRHMPDGGFDCTAGQYRAMIAEMEAAVAAHPEWGNPPWGELVFGCMGQGLRAWLRVAPDDDVLEQEWVHRFDQQEWADDRIRRGLPIFKADGTPAVADWRRAVQLIVDAHLPEPRRPQAARVYRAMIAEIATVIALHPEWGDPDWKAVAFETLGMGTWDWLQVAGDGDVLPEEFMVRFDLGQWVRTGGKGPWSFPR